MISQQTRQALCSGGFVGHIVEYSVDISAASCEVMKAVSGRSVARPLHITRTRTLINSQLQIRKESTMKKTTKGVIATGAAVMLLLGGGGTLAYWNDTANLGAASTITAGTLTVTTPATPVPSWSIKHTSGATTPVANIASVRIVPGDQLIYTVPANITAQGQNLRFQVGLAGGAIAAASGNAADTALASRLTNSATFAVTGATPVGSPSANTFEHKNNTSSTYATTITATITWPFGVAGSQAQDNPAKAGVVNLSQFALSVTQVDGSITIP